MVVQNTVGVPRPYKKVAEKARGSKPASSFFPWYLLWFLFEIPALKFLPPMAFLDEELCPGSVNCNGLSYPKVSFGQYFLTTEIQS